MADLPTTPDEVAAAEEHWRQDTAVIARALDTDLSSGLTADEAARRLELHGRNELAKGREVSPWALLAGQFTNTMILVLAVAAVVTFLIGERTDTLVIGVIVVVNGGVGFVQEYRAEQAMAALSAMASPTAVVLRDATVLEVPAAELVPGDVVVLASGDVIPADLRLADVQGLRIDEAALTGESESVAKSADALRGVDQTMVADRLNMAFKGTAITHGRARGLVVATGMSTELGRIASMLDRGSDATPLQLRLGRLGRRLAAAALIVCGVVFAVGMASGEEAEEMFLRSVSLAVAAIPEGLPAVVTVALALGARRMADRRALVRRLPAVETLGSVTVICSDKTGTLTENRMTVEEVWTPAGSHRVSGVGYSPDGVVTATSGAATAPDPHLDRLAAVAAACNDAVLHPPEQDSVEGEPDGDVGWGLTGDPTEGALLALAGRLGLPRERLEERWPRLDEVPFDADRRRMSTVHHDDEGRRWIATKGAVEAIAPLLHADEHSASTAALDAADAFAERGYRVLALAERRIEPSAVNRGDLEVAPGEIEQDLRLLGLVAIADPPRAGVDEAVATCQRAGMTPVMITGDHPRTAAAIGRRLGILGEDVRGRVVTGAEVAEMDDDVLAERVTGISIYARTDPAQKLRIVDAWRRHGAVVAMTGDGVNDAPALQRADIGLAMGITGSDVSKEAADMVLADDDFSTIVRAVEEGRRIYDNIRRFVRYLLTTNSGEIWVMLIAPLLGLPFPVTAAQILWINLVTDGLPAVALGLEPAERDAMDRPPRPPGESILARGLWQETLWVGLFMAGLLIALQAWTRSIDWPWQTMVFTSLALLQLGHALAIRSERESFWRLGPLTNPWLLGAVALSAGAQFATVYVPWLQRAFDTEPLDLAQLAVVGVVSTGAFVAVEVSKLVRRRREQSADAGVGAGVGPR